MIGFDYVDVMNFDNAIRGMRNPLESYNLADSRMAYIEGDTYEYQLGDKDKDLALRLIKAGTDHAKFMRQILVSVDITAPLYWWKEMDQYRVGQTTNSTSSMHKILSKPISKSMFSFDNEDGAAKLGLYRSITIEHLEQLRQTAIETKDKETWRELIQDLPSSFNQTRTTTLNYQILRNIYNSRKNHKLQEWKDMCKWIETLPYSELIICK